MSHIMYDDLYSILCHPYILTPLYKTMKREAKQNSPSKKNNKDNNASHFGERLLLEVEVCSECGDHLKRHNQWTYVQHFAALKSRMESEGIEVRRKSVPDDLYKRSPYCPPNLFHKKGTKESVHFPRIGSFEVYFEDSLLFSRLQTHKWPDLNKLAVNIYRHALQKKQKQEQPQRRSKHPSIVKNQVINGSKSFTKSIKTQSHSKSIQQYFRVRSTLHASSSHGTTLHQSQNQESSNIVTKHGPKNLGRYFENSKNDKSERSSAEKSHDRIKRSLQQGWQSVAGPTQNRLKEALKHSIEATPTRATLEAYMQPLFPRHSLRHTKKLIQRTLEARRKTVNSRQEQRDEKNQAISTLLQPQESGS